MDDGMILDIQIGLSFYRHGSNSINLALFKTIKKSKPNPHSLMMRLLMCH